MSSRRPRRSSIAEPRGAALSDRDLVRLYWPVKLRPAFDALFAIDDVLGEVVASSTQPALGAIRLAWWREALERLDRDPPPPEPRLGAASGELVARGISGARLATIEDGWAALFDESPDIARISERGANLFEILGDLLGGRDPLLGEAGRLFALADVTRRGLHPGASVALEALAGHRFERRLRPVTALARLAVRDIKANHVTEPEATPARAAALLSHRLFGTIA